MLNSGRILSLVAIVVGLALAPAAWGQQRGGGGGHALDANQQVGSRGVNDQQNRIDYNARNNVITGNVPGLRAFQGKVPYRAPGEFQGFTAGEPLFRFNRQSLQSAPSRLNAVGTPTYGNYTGANAVYRNFSYPGPRFQQQARRVTGQANAVYDPGQLTQGYLLTPRRENLPADTLGVVPIPSGRVMEVSASPLLGVRERPLPSKPLLTPKEAPGMPTRSSELTRPYVLTPMPTRQQGLEKLLAQPERREVMLEPTLVLGQQLQERLRLESTDSTQTLDARFAELQTMVRQELANRKAAEGDLVYQQVLKTMRQQQAQSPGQQPSVPQPSTQQPLKPQPPGKGEPSASRLNSQRGQIGQRGAGVPQGAAGGAPGASGAARIPGAMGWGAGAGANAAGPLVNPTAEQLREAEQKREAAIRRAYGLAPLGRKAGAVAGVKPSGQAGAGRNGAGQVTGKSNAVIKELSYKMVPLQSLASSRTGRINKSMKQAERQLAAGRYFDAEATYHQVLVDSPNRPLARVGQVNAELGAGLMRSAAFHLHQLFDQHPELIALRYGKGLLPPDHRLRWIQQKLAKMISEGTKDAQPGLLTAYLGHQVGSRQLVRYGLAIAQANQPKDPLLPVLRRVWLDPGQGGVNQAPASAPAPRGGGAGARAK